MNLSFKRRWPLLTALASIMVLAAVLRCWQLDEREVTSTEAFSWRVATFPLDELLRSVARDTHPPGHFLLLKAWMSVFGDSPFAIRSLSAACGVLCVPLMYLLVVEAVADARGYDDDPDTEPRGDGRSPPIDWGARRFAAQPHRLN